MASNEQKRSWPFGFLFVLQLKLLLLLLLLIDVAGTGRLGFNRKRKELTLTSLFCLWAVVVCENFDALSSLTVSRLPKKCLLNVRLETARRRRMAGNERTEKPTKQNRLVKKAAKSILCVDQDNPHHFSAVLLVVIFFLSKSQLTVTITHWYLTLLLLLDYD